MASLLTIKKRAVRADSGIWNADIDAAKLRLVLNPVEQLHDLVGVRQVALKII